MTGGKTGSKGDGKKEIQISAKLTGPGPGHYKLPTTIGCVEHDGTKQQEPSYSFGRRFDPDKNKCSPGPAYFIDPRITRAGLDGTPCYSMLARQKELNNFMTPSPTAYFPERVHPQGEKHAARYSIGSRTCWRKSDQNPAPNNYKLPKILGSDQRTKQSAPSYSMAGRSIVGCYLEDLAKAPGPGNYQKISTESYMSKPPHYSLGSRSYMPGDNTLKPGPGAHKPEDVRINRRSAPRFSLGTRHSNYVCPYII